MCTRAVETGWYKRWVSACEHIVEAQRCDLLAQTFESQGQELVPAPDGLCSSQPCFCSCIASFAKLKQVGLLASTSWRDCWVGAEAAGLGALTSPFASWFHEASKQRRAVDKYKQNRIFPSPPPNHPTFIAQQGRARHHWPAVVSRPGKQTEL